MRYGNCLIGAIVLMFVKRSWKLSMFRNTREDIPHFYVTDKHGNKWHYAVVRDVLQYPFGYLFYQGEFAKIRKYSGMKRIKDQRLTQPAYPVGNDPLRAMTLANTMATILTEIYGKNKTIILIGRGSSGLILCSMISLYIPVKRIVDIKKDSESSHEENHYAWADEKDAVYIAIDDLVSCGDTMKAIFRKWNATNPPDARINAVMVGGVIGSMIAEFADLDYLISTDHNG